MLILALYLILVDMNLRGQLSAEQAQVPSTGAQRAESSAHARDMDRYEARLKDLQDKSSNARAMLPNTADVHQVSSQIDSMTKVDLIIEGFKPQAETPIDFHEQTDFAVQAR